MFEELPLSKIPCWENMRRLNLLIEFRNALATYHQASEFLTQRAWSVPETDFPELQQRRSEINHQMPAAQKAISLGGAALVWVQDNRLGRSMRFDPIGNFFELPSMNISRRAAIDLVERSIGIYDQNTSKARWRAFSPFYWVGLMTYWLSEIPFRILRETGLRSAGNTSKGLARFLRGVFQFALNILAYGTALLAAAESFGQHELLLRIWSYFSTHH